ncbi:MAG TPA: hypothetical protein VFR09_07685 [Alphaproteobacteria bacterium]|nr:hypothetical protein [Alphaproteobacteria bacterium]
MIYPALKDHPILATYWPTFMLAVMVLAAYSNVYHNVFLFDDESLIQRNQYVLGNLPMSHIFLSSAAGGAGITNDFYRPLQILVYTIINSLFGLSITAYHALNVGLHVINTCLVYALGRKLKIRPTAVFFGTLIWALHPLHTEAVTYISSTADTLSVVFSLITLLMILPEATLKRVLLACPVYILAILSKETAVTVPLLAMCCLFLLSPERKNWKLYLPLWPLFALAAIYSVLRFTVLDFQQFDHSFDSLPALHYYATHIDSRIYTFLATIPAYVSVLFVPVDLHYERMFPVYTSFFTADVLEGFAILLVGIGVTIWGIRKKHYALSWAFMWFAAAHSLDAGIVVPLIMRFLEHWMYVPAIGLCLGFSESLAGLLEYKGLKHFEGLAGIVALGIAVTLGVMTYDQNTVWKDEFTFYPNILNHGEVSVRAMNNLGRAYAERKEYDKALAIFRQSEQVNDNLPEIHQNIAQVLSMQPGWQQHPDELIKELKRAIELDEHFLPAYVGLVYVYQQLGDAKQEAFYKARVEELKKTLSP